MNELLLVMAQPCSFSRWSLTKFCAAVPNLDRVRMYAQRVNHPRTNRTNTALPYSWACTASSHVHRYHCSMLTPPVDSANTAADSTVRSSMLFPRIYQLVTSQLTTS
jgi:hypothetical protein